jgi:hypothetical protein
LSAIRAAEVIGEHAAAGSAGAELKLVCWRGSTDSVGLTSHAAVNAANANTPVQVSRIGERREPRIALLLA